MGLTAAQRGTRKIKRKEKTLGESKTKRQEQRTIPSIVGSSNY